MQPRDLELGILGGGQLGKMLIQAASRWHMRCHVLDPAADCPAADIASTFTHGTFRDYETVLRFGEGKRQITIEIEDVSTEALHELQAQGAIVHPAPDVLDIIKDKGAQKQFFKEHNLPTATFRLFDSRSEIEGAVRSGKLKLPFVQKLRTGGYDGRGVQIVRKTANLGALFDEPSVIEELVPIQKELSVIVARNTHGEVAAYPAVEMVFNPRANLVEYLVCPASLDEAMHRLAEVTALKTIKALNMVGVLAVEMFLDDAGDLLVNELAPRPHNSGHHTIESCITSQYEQHLRAIFGLPLGSTAMHSPAVMVNLLGAEGASGSPVYHGWNECLRKPGVYLHLYGKQEVRPFRKMGHATILGSTLDEALEKAKFVQYTLKVTA
jgi:5-(carboxyamino)imidazole ribonucleotide synthase